MIKYSDIYLGDNFYDKWKDQLPSYDLIQQAREEIAPKLDRNTVEPFYKTLVQLPQFQSKLRDYSGDSVIIGDRGELTDDQFKLVYQCLEEFIPWRKGPFEIFGTHIDAEWRSNLKWDRVKSVLPDLRYKKICDVGCNNSYYMYRMLEHKPEFVLGIDPMIKYYFNYLLLQRFAAEPNVHYDLLGVEHMNLFENFFDVVFFMGIIYHRRNPVQTLMDINKSMKKGGTVILEVSGIDGDEPYCLFPEDRYMKARGYWFLPTWKAMENMLKKTNFTDIETFDKFPLDFHEQRKTDWSRWESLEDFLDPDDPTKTVEGYPAPHRIYIKAIKK